MHGRGAIDDKGMLAANIMAMLQIQRSVVAAGMTLDGVMERVDRALSFESHILRELLVMAMDLV